MYQNSVEGASLETAGRLDCVPMHRVADPGDNLARTADSSDQMRQLDPHVLSSHPSNNSYPPWLVFWVQDLNQIHKLIRVHLITDLNQQK